jgi:hypothetical protein
MQLGVVSAQCSAVQMYMPLVSRSAAGLGSGMSPQQARQLWCHQHVTSVGVTSTSLACHPFCHQRATGMFIQLVCVTSMFST